MIKYITIFSLFLTTSKCFCQERNVSDIIVSIAEELAANEEDPEAVSTFIERLQDLAEDRVKQIPLKKKKSQNYFFFQISR